MWLLLSFFFLLLQDHKLIISLSRDSNACFAVIALVSLHQEIERECVVHDHTDLPLHDLWWIHNWRVNKGTNVPFPAVSADSYDVRIIRKHHVCDNQPTPISASASSCSHKAVIIKMAEIKTSLRPWGFQSHCVTPTASPCGHVVPVLIVGKKILVKRGKLFIIKMNFVVLLRCQNDYSVILASVVESLKGEKVE